MLLYIFASLSFRQLLVFLFRTGGCPLLTYEGRGQEKRRAKANDGTPIIIRKQ